jgi:hypothetical protein
MKYILNNFLFLLLFGCGVKRLAVDHADYILRYQVTRRIPLYSNQKKRLEEDLKKFFNNSKTTVSYVLLELDKMELLSPEGIDQLYPKMERFYLILAEDFFKLIAAYLAELDTKQQKEMFEELDDENRDFLKKEKENGINDIEDNFKKFFGDINDDQKQLLRKNNAYFSERRRLRHDRKVTFQKNLKSLYLQNLATSSKEKSIKEEFKKYQSDSIMGSRSIEFLRELLPTLSKQQKEHFRHHVKDFKALLKYYLSVDY